MAFTPFTFVLARALPGQLPTTAIPAIHLYSSATDTISTILGSGYFNSLIPAQYLPQPPFVSGGFNDNQIEIGDLILVTDSTAASTFIQITATHPNVTTSSQSVVVPPGSVGTAQLQDGAVTTSKLANLAVTAAKIANNTITAAQIQASTITATQIQNGTITGTQIASNSIAGTNIELNTITGANLVNGTVGTSQLATGSITQALLAASLYTYTPSTAATFSGPWSSPQPTTYTSLVFGNIKILSFAGISPIANSANPATLSGTLPGALFPVQTFIAMIPAVDNLGGTPGSIQITDTGVVTIGTGAAVGNYTGTGSAGWAGFSIVYL